MQGIYNVIMVTSTFSPQNMVTSGDFQPKNPLHKSQTLFVGGQATKFRHQRKSWSFIHRLCHVMTVLSEISVNK